MNAHAFPFSPRQVALALGGEVSGNQVRAPGPNHSKNDRSLSLRIDPGAPDGFVVHSFSGDDPLACRDHVREKLGIRWSPSQQMNERARKANDSKREGKSDPPTAYIYSNADGSPRLRVNRTQNRTPPFWQEHWDGSGWVKGGGDQPRVPYRLPELLEAEHDDVLIVEGEKDADNVTALGFVATTNAGGSGNWHPDLNRYFKGKDIFILPDNDEAGEKHLRKVRDNLKGVAREIKVLRLPGLADSQDVSDWIAAGGTQDDLADLLRAAPRYEEAVLEQETEPEQEAPEKLIQSMEEFLAGFVAPDYLLDGILQRRFIYSLTAQTGHGKTALALLIARLIGGSKPNAALGKQAAEKGRVVYFAGENPDDLRMRVIGDDNLHNDRNARISFIPGTFSIEAMRVRIEAELTHLGGVDLIVVDTSAAYFNGKDELSNTEMGAHARLLRTLTTLPGGPCVLVLCHPVKHVDNPSQLLPRGGGAFLAEIDGNLTLWKHDGNLATLHHTDKLRGPGFEPLSFRLETVSTTRLMDKKGRIMPTVRAVWLSETESARETEDARNDENDLLKTMLMPGQSLSQLAEACGWRTKTGEPYKSKVQRILKRLEKDKLTITRRGVATLTEAGKKAAKS